MTRINRAYVRRLEDLILQIDATLSELEPAHSMERDMAILHREARRIRECRNTMAKKKLRAQGPSFSFPNK